MGDRLWRWWLRTVPGPDRLVLAAVVVVRLAALVMVGYSVPLVWRELPRPGATAALAVGVGAESLAVIWWWLRRRRLDRRTLLVDLPAGLLVLPLSVALARHHGVAGWTSVGYPYTLLVMFSIGLSCRTLPGALAAGALWAAGYLTGVVALDHHAPLPVLGAAAPYLLLPLVGALCAGLLRRTTAELERARDDAVRDASSLAAAREHRRHATALHDRVLQTLEVLARGQSIADPDTRARVAERAEWLRGYVETGRVQTDDLASGLAAVARLAGRGGVSVQLNDALLRTGESGVDLPQPRRDLLVQATHQAVAMVARQGGEVVVRAAPQDGGILVTVLGVSASGDLADCAEELADVRDRLRRVGGRAEVEPLPYVELWLPGG